jgi:GntR family phosphonate transport system transcriptional regulator
MPTIDRRPGVSLWSQIADLLRGEIESGSRAPGDKVETEAELAALFGVNRHTVRRALKTLEDDGLVRIEQGRGTFVNEDVVAYRLSRRTRFSENVAAQNRDPGGVLLESGEMQAERAVAEALGVRLGTWVVYIRRLGSADGRPISIATHYFPKVRFEGLDAVYPKFDSITETLKYFGVDDYLRRETRVTAHMPTAAEAAHLKQPRTRPILQTEAVNVDTEGNVVDFGVTRWASDRVQVVVEP